MKFNEHALCGGREEWLVVLCRARTCGAVFALLLGTLVLQGAVPQTWAATSCLRAKAEPMFRKRGQAVAAVPPVRRCAPTPCPCSDAAASWRTKCRLASIPPSSALLSRSSLLCLPLSPKIESRRDIVPDFLEFYGHNAAGHPATQQGRCATAGCRRFA